MAPFHHRDTPEDALLERIATLHGQLDDQRRQTPEYERLSAEIRDVSKTYCHLVDAKRGVQQRDQKR